MKRWKNGLDYSWYVLLLFFMSTKYFFFIVSFHYKQSRLEANQAPTPGDLSLEEQYEEDNVSENDSNDDEAIEDHSDLFSW